MKFCRGDARMPLLALIEPAVPAVQARGLARAAGDRRRQRLRCAAPARRALAGRLSRASQLWRNIQMLVAAGTSPGCWLLRAGLRWCMCIVDSFIVMLVTIVTQHSSLFMPCFIHKICGGEL